MIVNHDITMKIELKKATNYQCEYTVTRDDKSVELISLETKTYLVHDICHYVVEKNLKYTTGFGVCYQTDTHLMSFLVKTIQ